MHEWATLLTREHGRVNLLCVLFAAKNQTRARAGEGLVHGGRDDIGVWNRRWVQTGGNETGEVGHVDPELCANLVGNSAECSEVELTAVCRPSGDDYGRLDLERAGTNDVHVNQKGLWVEAVGVSLIHLAREVEAHAVGEVATVSELQT